MYDRFDDGLHSSNKFNHFRIRCPPEGYYENDITYVEIKAETVNMRFYVNFPVCTFLQKKTLKFVFLSQNSRMANATQTDGGIGQRLLDVDIETEYTGSISCLAEVYVNSSATILPSLGLLTLFFVYTLFFCY